jgi:hypothetical protein
MGDKKCAAPATGVKTLLAAFNKTAPPAASSSSADASTNDSGKRPTPEVDISEKVKRLNAAIHSPLKAIPVDAAEPTLSEVMTVLLDQGRKMATKQDLKDLQKEILRDTRPEIEEAVAPIIEDMEELKGRVDKWEQGSVEPPGTDSKVVEEMRCMFNQMDPAKKRVALIGFSDDTSVATRITQIKT